MSTQANGASGSASPAPVASDPKAVAPAAGTPDPKATEAAPADGGDAPILGRSKKDESDPAKVKADAEAKAKADADAKAAAGDIEIKLPDGVKASDAEIAQVKAFAKELGLNGEQASKALAYDLARQKAAADALVGATVKAEKERNDKWISELKADPKIGGEHLAATTMAAKRGIQWANEKLGNESLLDALDDAGLGNHPALVRLFKFIGDEVAEDNSATSGGGPGDAPSNPDAAWQSFYSKPTAQKAAG